MPQPLQTFSLDPSEKVGGCVGTPFDTSSINILRNLLLNDVTLIVSCVLGVENDTYRDTMGAAELRDHMLPAPSSSCRSPLM
jgi:hypothetical protein